jgi:uncharacterized protein
MSQRTEVLDLGRLSLSSGEGRRLPLQIPVDSFEFGGQRYGVAGDRVDAILDVAHTTSGHSLRLRFDADLRGPCMRCLDLAADRVSVDAREVDQPGGGEDLDSPYVDQDELDVESWARDALALALPVRIVCRDECLGLCPVCGENLNDAGPDHRHESPPDERWAALRELRRD